MSEVSSNNKRIVKNTFLLYIRMLFTMVVSLYTSRVILQALGVEDYGIYNVVGGVVAMFSMLSGSLSAAISRFITFELGRRDLDKLKRVFSSAVTIQIGLALIIILLAETVGLWFLNEKMIIPQERIVAANWVFQFSILTFAVNLISVPYNATIIAHEKMSAFAYISILEVVGKLFVAFSITISPIDKLIYYGLLLMLIAISIQGVYGYYCRKHFEECSYHFVFDNFIIKDMSKFAGWNIIGSSATILRDQGGNIVINLFCGPTVNAARGITVQVANIIQGFVGNFMTALNPQIIKSYATNNKEYMFTLIYKGARFSFYLLLFISLPILLNTYYILKLWLGIVPEYTVSFIQLSILFALHETLATPLVTAMIAHGDIKKYQICAGGLNLLNLPVSYISLKLGFSPISVFIVTLLFSFLVQIVRISLLKKMINLNVRSYLKHVYGNVISVGILSFILPFIIKGSINHTTFLSFSIISAVAMLATSIAILFVGCNKDERFLVFSQLQKIKYRILQL